MGCKGLVLKWEEEQGGGFRGGVGEGDADGRKPKTTHVVLLGLDVHQRLGHVPSTLRHGSDVLVQ